MMMHQDEIRQLYKVRYDGVHVIGCAVRLVGFNGRYRGFGGSLFCGGKWGVVIGAKDGFLKVAFETQDKQALTLNQEFYGTDITFVPFDAVEYMGL